MVFLLALEIAFSYRCYFKTNRKSIEYSKNSTRDFQNSPQFERSLCFYVTMEIFNVFDTFLENIFKKLEYNF